MGTNETVQRHYTTVVYLDCGSNIASKHVSKHEARPPRVKEKETEKKELQLDLNNFAFICAGVSNVGSYKKKCLIWGYRQRKGSLLSKTFTELPRFNTLYTEKSIW